MLSRRIIPFLVAGITGVVSGVYIFKPLLDESSRNDVDATKLPASEPPDSPTTSSPATVNYFATKGEQAKDATPTISAKAK
ncbi:hypothetical protein SCP_0103630 [Sparassis crispa]|uniref:Uncharacterized protein n=1 Tax=Sparassis crispa TaxID=139825 RepID=A0A401G5P9_9APHY|nr:hypothetical protein SCP_0103630 [Sparassis crispa]GBE77488.1 hypothetical protein SCP_0103630 [Sparassis crispa]